MSSIHALQGAGEDTRLLQEGVACCCGINAPAATT
ncbi:hypothetical protein FOQG_09030 [Fusarium oxysporum f. sp. raphani 54005]|uniref:Uncharacterized protein n=2 Tax=Fusarium oxysporum TaxID=5507 RepID=X0C920_FUSOX|nr:hypothetical protein FOVG_12239 [Fusarium oxysporum f. sp. pisi HDV247]EXK87693.1 hypothetical protein FOQG_09030 [Fusarium oxysporum f. sp. raphani 54005]